MPLRQLTFQFLYYNNSYSAITVCVCALTVCKLFDYEIWIGLKTTSLDPKVTVMTDQIVLTSFYFLCKTLKRILNVTLSHGVYSIDMYIDLSHFNNLFITSLGNAFV